MQEVVCFSCLLKCLRSFYGKQRGPRSDCSYRSSLFWVQAVCFYTQFASNVRQLFAADDFSRRHFQMHFFLGALRVKQCKELITQTSIPEDNAGHFSHLRPQAAPPRQQHPAWVVLARLAVGIHLLPVSSR